MILKRLLQIILISTLASSMTFAAKPRNNQKDSIRFDTNYIASYKHYFQIKAVGLNRQSSIVFINNEENIDLDFVSNNPTAFGIGFDYSWISLEYTQSIRGFEFNDPRKGETDTQAFRLGLFGRKIRGDFYLRSTQGFNMENIETWVPDWFEDHEKYPYSKNLRTAIIAGSLYYTFNHRKYSNAAVYRHSERQLKSSGSPLIGILFNLEGISSSTPVVNSDSLLNKFLNISTFSYLKTGVFGGYMHTFTINKRFFAHASLNQGFVYSMGRGEYHDTEESERLRALGISIFARLALGYNGTKWFGGTLFSADFFVSDVSSALTTSTSYSFFKIYVGYRIPFKKRNWMKWFLL